VQFLPRSLEDFPGVGDGREPHDEGVAFDRVPVAVKVVERMLAKVPDAKGLAALNKSSGSRSHLLPEDGLEFLVFTPFHGIASGVESSTHIGSKCGPLEDY
jgi:hypothetical protein